MPREKLTLHELLVATRNRLEGNWLQGFAIDATGNVCIIGAMGVSAFGEEECLSFNERERTSEILAHFDDYFDEEQAMLRKVLNCRVGQNPLQALIDFNDDFEVTEKEVLNLLDKLIAGTAPEPESLELKVPEEDRELAAS